MYTDLYIRHEDSTIIIRECKNIMEYGDFVNFVFLKMSFSCRSFV